MIVLIKNQQFFNIYTQIAIKMKFSIYATAI